MPVLDLQEQEQIDNLKHMWKSWGIPITLGLLALAIGYGSVAGWRAWQSHQAGKAAQAFAPFAEVLKTDKPDVKKLEQLADLMAREHAGSVYAAQAALATARVEVNNKDLAAAEKRLQWVLQQQKDEAILAVARLRLAAVQMDLQKPDEAVRTLQAEHPSEFASLFAEARGDALLLKKDKAGARQAYQTALSTADVARKTLLDWKLQALGS